MVTTVWRVRTLEPCLIHCQDLLSFTGILKFHLALNKKPLIDTTLLKLKFAYEYFG